MLKPVFLQGSAGRIHLTAFLPDGQSPKHWLLFCPPWAEELNKSRRMQARLGHALATRGVGLCLPDHYGTGDSEGDFSQADWTVWRSDLITVSRWMKTQGCQSLTLAGLRAGCLMALDVAPELAITPQDYLLWQPVAKGAQQLTQFLRLRMAASLGGGEKETVGQLREQLAAGETLEVAGYALAPRLASALEALEMAQMKPVKGAMVHWLELSSIDSGQLSPVSRQVVEAWQEHGVVTQSRCLQGDPFWATQELVDVPELIDVSLAALLSGDTA